MLGDAADCPRTDSTPCGPVGQELGDHARIWQEYDHIVVEDDSQKIEHWNRGLDTLVLFAGLFSVVTAVFIIRLHDTTRPDYNELTFRLLNTDASGLPFVQEQFILDPAVRAANCLWVSSLLLSLSAALIGMMSKDWIGAYTRRPACNPRQWAEIRTHRLTCVERWFMPELIASAPILLHISMILFAAGLVLFLFPDRVAQFVALGLALGLVTLYAVTALAAMLFPGSPYRSPATLAMRRSLTRVFGGLQNRLPSPSLRHTITVLQHAAFTIAAAVAHPFADDRVSLDETRPSRPRRRRVLAVWDRPVSLWRRTWRAGIRIRARVWWGTSDPAVSALPANTCINKARGEDCWTDGRTEAAPVLIARALSRMHETSPSPRILCSILVALGDINIGAEVAPLVSVDLRTALRAHIERNWQTADIMTLSRYVLADRNISARGPLISAQQLRSCFDSAGPDPALRSENALFAAVRANNNYVTTTVVARHCPDAPTQPRGMQYLLSLARVPHTADPHAVTILANRYWDYIKDDASFSLEAEIRRRLGPWDEHRFEWYMDNRCAGRSGVIEYLAFLLEHAPPEVARDGYALILKALAAEPAESQRQHQCLVYLFGSDDARVVNAAWDDRVWSTQELILLQNALSLMLSRFCTWDRRTTPLASESGQIFVASFARNVTRSLSPSRAWVSATFRVPEAIDRPVSYLELCIRYFHAQLCHSRSCLDDTQMLDVLCLLLKGSLLIRLSDARVAVPAANTTDRLLVNILTAVTRRLSRDVAEGHDASRLIGLFLYSEARTPDGESVIWDLGSFLRKAVATCQHRSVQVALHRLSTAISPLSVLGAMPRDLYAAWGCSEVPMGTVSFWNHRGFGLSGFFSEHDIVTGEEAAPQTPSHLTQGFIIVAVRETVALLYRDGTMR